MKTDKEERWSLEVFKAKKLKEDKQQQTEQLLGQILGDCHDR